MSRTHIEGTLEAAVDAGTVLGDGVTCVDAKTLALDGVRIAGCERGGIVARDCGGSLARVDVTGNRIGLVTTGRVTPSVDGDSSFKGNVERNVTDALALPTPDGPMPLPALPESDRVEP